MRFSFPEFSYQYLVVVIDSLLHFIGLYHDGGGATPASCDPNHPRVLFFVYYYVK